MYRYNRLVVMLAHLRVIHHTVFVYGYSVLPSMIGLDMLWCSYYKSCSWSSVGRILGSRNAWIPNNPRAISTVCRQEVSMCDA
jgi:hypothetical protein